MPDHRAALAGLRPDGTIMELAKRTKKQVRSISLGQGQEPAARKLIATGVTQARG